MGKILLAGSPKRGPELSFLYPFLTLITTKYNREPSELILTLPVVGGFRTCFIVLGHNCKAIKV